MGSVKDILRKEFDDWAEKAKGLLDLEEYADLMSDVSEDAANYCNDASDELSSEEDSDGEDGEEDDQSER